MSDQTAVYRPSPRPRPAGAPPRPADGPKLRVVPTQSDPEICIAEPVDAPSEREIPVSRTATLKSAITQRYARVEAAGSSVLAYFTPPQVFTDRPASLAELAEYARHGPWTTQPFVAKPHTDEHTKKMVKTGLARASGIWWYRLVGYPQTVRYRYSEWLWQRPARLLVAAGVLKLATHTGPGIWVVDHLVYPAFTAAGHVFL